MAASASGPYMRLAPPGGHRAWGVLLLVLLSSLAAMLLCSVQTSLPALWLPQWQQQQQQQQPLRLGTNDTTAAAQPQQHGLRQAMLRQQWQQAADDEAARDDGEQQSKRASRQGHRTQQPLLPEPLRPDEGYYKNSTHPVCQFLRAGDPTSTDEWHWGGFELCDLDTPIEWLKRINSNCYSCLDGRNVCAHPSIKPYHMFLDQLHPVLWRGNLLSLKSYLMTQDLTRSHLNVWVPRRGALTDDNEAVASFFEAFKPFITLRVFDYAAEVKSTLWEHDPFFGDGDMVKANMPDAGAFTDVVRILLLHKYGGLWIDNDVIFYQDLSHLLNIAPQFVTRWLNLHVMYLHAGSPLTRRIMELATTMPLNHPHFHSDILDMCRANGWQPIAVERYKYTDIYNSCLFRLILRHNNSSPDDAAVLYDLPMMWFDQEWVPCPDKLSCRRSVSDDEWRQAATALLTMHHRYPNNPGRGAPDSPLNRALRIMNEFFGRCQHAECVPRGGMSLLAFEGMSDTFEPERLL